MRYAYPSSFRRQTLTGSLCNLDRSLLDHAENDHPTTSDDDREIAQAGVQQAEAIASTWSKTGLYIAYFGWVHLFQVTDLW